MSDVAITAASVQPGSNAQFGDGTAGATITAGQPLYRDTSTTPITMKVADANLSLLAATVEGIALHGASSGQPIRWQSKNDITIGGTLVQGTVYVLSNTAGGICPATDLASGWYRTILGVAKTTSVLKLAIENSGIVP